MRGKILHESRGRMRVHLIQRRMTLEQADMLEFWLAAQEGIRSVKVYDRTCDVVIEYSGTRSQAISALSAFSYTRADASQTVPANSGRALSRAFEEKLFWTVLRRAVFRTILPVPLRRIRTILQAIRYILDGLRCLLKRKIEVAVLDATAITVSLLRGDHDTASSVMFLLRIGEILEEWTHKKSVDDLARTMSLGVEKVWMLAADGQEVLVPLTQVAIGDRIIVRTGSMIALDGKVETGDAMVNQASMTGESVPVHKDAGSYVYAGTVVEEGECVVCVEKLAGSGRYDRIVKMIEESEQLKSAAESRAAHLADRLVPYSLGGTLLTWLVTRNVTQALSVLMVDFSCALKLAMPISVLSAMRECSRYGITVKGGRFLEAVAEADTIVFDKTGTLTFATPRVAQIITFDGNEESEMLRLAACLEEHYPHSIANAVVEEAAARGLLHEERHSKVEYVVAHGIASSIEGQRVVIGSHHFVIEDEGC
ncbi:MAG: HAD-IC family P-type ATPase, partial [Oscillospiraceae bacterium]|nr:HAD-IC family P-type ATPase [Oscillospiraceae bacterium]